VGDYEKLAAELVEVQSQLAFQEDTITVLNASLALQQREIIQLRRQLELLKQRQDEQASHSDEVSSPPVDEKPPHY